MKKYDDPAYKYVPGHGAAYRKRRAEKRAEAQQQAQHEAALQPPPPKKEYVDPAYRYVPKPKQEDAHSDPAYRYVPKERGARDAERQLRLARGLSAGIPFAFYWIYQLAGFATFAFLMSEDSADFNAWNWIVIIPVNIFLSTIWPVYWVILRPLFGG